MDSVAAVKFQAHRRHESLNCTVAGVQVRVRFAEAPRVLKAKKGSDVLFMSATWRTIESSGGSGAALARLP